jgi:hypothetical protein
MSDARWGDPRENDARDRSDDWARVYDPRDRDEYDPRDGLMRDLDLPRGDERELVVDRDRIYELDGEDSRTLAVIGAFRVVPEYDLDLPRDTFENLHDQRLVELVDLGDSDRGLTLTTEGRDLLDSHSLERESEASQLFHAGVILHVWEQRRAEANERTTEQERRIKAIQRKLDRLDEAFLYSESIDLTSYSRQRDKLREELTLAQIDRHTEAVDELDVQGILAFTERILPRASDLWVQASLDYKQRLQQLFFPEGIAYDGNRFNRTAATAPLFSYLAPSASADEKMVSRGGIEPPTRRLRVASPSRKHSKS